MPKKKIPEPQVVEVTIDAPFALISAIETLNQVADWATETKDKETMFNVAAMFVDIFGRLSETGAYAGPKAGFHDPSGHPVGFGKHRGESEDAED